MKTINPIDEIFRERLQDHSVEAPMHLWDGIAAQSAKRSGSGFKLKYLLFFLAFTLLAAVLAASYLGEQALPSIQSFPIPLPSLASEGTSANLIEFENTPEGPAAAKKDANITGEAPKTPATIIEDPKEKVQASVNQNTIHSPEELLDTKGLTLSSLPESKFVAESANQFNFSSSLVSPLQVRMGMLHYDGLERLIYMAPDPDCGMPKNSLWNLYFDFMLSADLALRQMTVKDPEMVDYLKTREETEYTNLAYSIGFRMSAVAPSGIALRAGLNYSQINEIFSFEGWREEIVVVENDTMIVSGPFEVYSKNRFRMIDIPVMLGYELPITDDLKLSINAGAYLNLILNKRGEFFSPEMRDMEM